MTHGHPESLASVADDMYYNFFKGIHDSKRRDNTVIVLFSDHGPRWGPIINTFQGKIEERMPMLFLVFPPWFRSKYPDHVKNLEINSNRLTTHYDTYETLKDILYFDGNIRQNKGTERGISLFSEIPKGKVYMTF